MNEFLEKECLQVALLLHPSNWEKVEDYFDEDPNKALAYLMMIGRYHFYKTEPTDFMGVFPRDTIRDVNSERPLIDAHIEKYVKATNGGKATNKISDEKFLQMIESDEFSTQEEIANAIGISKQAVSQRLKKLGINWREFKANKKAHKRSTFESESESSFEREEPFTPTMTMQEALSKHKSALM